MRRTLPLWLLLAACSGPEPGGETPPPPDPQPEAVVDPGSKPLHRLNRAEMNNTFRDLFQTDLTPAADLPADETTHGYDNVAEGLSLASVHVEIIEGGIDDVLDEFFGRNPESTEIRVVEGEGPGTTYVGGEPLGESAYEIRADEDLITASLQAEFDGLFRVGVMGFGRAIDGVNSELSVSIDGVEVEILEIFESDTGPLMHEFEVELDAGSHLFELRMANAYKDEATGDYRAVGIDFVELEGPLDPEIGPSAAYPTLVRCDPVQSGDEACARDVLEDFSVQAWRRPVTDDELTPFVDLYLAGMDSGLSWDESLQLGMKGLLLAPDFIYRVEEDDPSGDRDLNGYELASRMSYFLWSSMPDEALFNAAADGSLLDPEVTAWQVSRMLADPKAGALVDNFAGQWWDIRDISDITPDPTLYGNWDEPLRDSMQLEMLLLAEDVLLGGRDLRDILTAGETRVDARLAAHYGIAAPAEDWDVVSLDGTPRAGLLSMAGWLATQAHPDKPSAVRRGRWVMSSLLCSPPPPPPPEAEGLDAIQPDLGPIRDQEEQMRSDQFCQSCHSTMDPIGFSMGHFDAIGGMRAVDEIGFPVDASTVMPDGTNVSSVVDLGPWLADDPLVPRCFAEQALTYAVGREVVPADDVALIDIEQRFLDGGATFEALAQAIVASPAFRMRAPADVAEEDGQ